MENNKDLIIVALVSSFVFLLIVILIYFIIVKYNQTARKNKQEHENDILKLKTEKLKEYIAKIEEEKSRISKDLHDEIGPLISIVKLKGNDVTFRNQSEKKEFDELIDDISKRIRETCLNLYPNSLVKFGFKGAFNKFLLINSGAVNINFENLNILDETILSKNDKLNLFRVISESLNNVLKHSKASKINISISKSEKKLCIQFEFDGTGLDNETFDQILSSSTGIGMISIMERCEFLNAKIDFFKNDITNQIIIKMYEGHL